MSFKNYGIQNIENADDCINWIEEAINKKHIKYYEYELFDEIQEIGSGVFGKVFRAKWKDFENYFALKSFFNLNKITVKEIVREIIHHRDVNFHNNIIRFYGVTKVESGNKIEQTKYLLVMEYADGGTLKKYLKGNFNRLTWDNKYNLAYQLACAISCLHDEGIVHRDLHSSNVLVHQGIIKLADFGLSKRIEEASKSQSNLLGMVPYIDPKRLMNSRNISQLDDKSDVYSFGILLWEISSGTPPFCEEIYNIGLMYEITQGRRERIVPGTPIEYSNIYTACWNGEPSKRPDIHKVVKELKNFIPHLNNVPVYDITDQTPKERLVLSGPKSSLRGTLSIMIQDFPNMSTDEITGGNPVPRGIINISSGTDFSIKANEMVDLIFKDMNKGNENMCKQHIVEYLNDHDINSKEIYNWLSNNRNSSNFIFLLGFFDFLGIGTKQNLKKAFKLFLDASKQNHTLAQDFVGFCYHYGIGTTKNEKSAFEYFEIVANKECAEGQFELSCCYGNGMGTKKDLNNAFYWCEKAANNGNIIAMHNLGILYLDGNVIEKDYEKAFKLFKESAEGEYVDGIMMLAYCYSNGIGTNIDKQKEIDSYRKAANLGHEVAQYNLGVKYEEGDGVEKDKAQAFYWYELSAKQGYQNAQNKIRKLKKHNRTKSCRII